jgi:enoyl-CoA hydratase
MSEGEIRVAREGAVARVTIDRPAKLNAMGSALLRQLAARLAELGQDPELRAVVLTGAGERAFIGGADIREMAAIADPVAARAFIGAVHAACRAVRDLPVPVLARLNGLTLGAGLEIAAACDLRIAVTGARFAMPEVAIGIPSVVEASLLPGLIGWGRTRRLLLLGEWIGAEAAESWGLVEKVVDPAALDAAVQEWLELLLAAGPRAVRSQKALIRQWESLSPDAGAEAGVAAFAAAWDSPEPREMMGRFLGRR